MLTDLQIAQAAVMQPITQIARQAGVREDSLSCYGRYIAKVDPTAYQDQPPRARLILVTAITPTPAGEGKTTVSVSLADGMRRNGKNAMLALREPSQGPVFGIKGGAAGGGYAQVVPMEDINLHFTGDFHAIGAANNLLAAMLDNHIQQGNALNIDPRRIVWKRAVDMNDRQLRHIIDGLGGKASGVPREDGFEITVASEIMAVLCLSSDLADLKARLAKMVVAYTYDDQPVTAHDLKAEGAMAALLKDAIKPNLVQTLEGTPAFIHGGPFANIAHGCNSAIATRMPLTFGDYVVTEAGFGADLGAEKFFNIKCRQSGLRPDLTVLVATTLSLKMHGGVPEADITKPNREGIVQGFANLDKHIENLQSFGQTVLVALNRFTSDTDEEIELIMRHCEQKGIRCVVNNAYTDGGIGAADLAHAVVEEIENNPSRPLRFTYNDNDSPTAKIEKIAHTIYGAGEVVFSQKAEKKLKQIKNWNLNHLPVCIAKTQYSFSADPKRYGLVKDFQFTINDIELNAGAGFIVAIAGEMLRMPGLPKHPQAHQIKVVNGKIEGLY